MSLYDDPYDEEELSRLLRRRREEEELQPVTQPALAPATVPEGGWKTLEDIGPDVKLVEPPEAPREVPQGGWKTLQDIGPDVKLAEPEPEVPKGKLPPVEVPEGGFKSLSEIGSDVQLDLPTPKGADPNKWDEGDKEAWRNLDPAQKKVFLEEGNERATFDDLLSRRNAIRDEEFKPPENWASLTRDQKTVAQEEFQRNKQVFLRGFDAEEAQKGHGRIVDRLKGEVQAGTTPFEAAREEAGAHLQAALWSPTRGVWDVGSGVANTLSHVESLARGIKPEETALHEFAVAAKEGTKELTGKYGDTVVPGVLRGLGTSLAFAPAGIAGKTGIALIGAATNFGDAYFEAKEMARMQGREASEGEVYARATFAGLVGMTEAVPVARGIERLGKPFERFTPGLVKQLAKPIASSLEALDKRTGGAISRVIGITEEGVEEFGQEYFQNTAQDAYDKVAGLTDKDWLQVVSHLPEGGMAGLSGILAGIFMNGAHIAGGGGRVPKTATVPGALAVPPAVPPVTAGAGVAGAAAGVVPPVVPPPGAPPAPGAVQPGEFPQAGYTAVVPPAPGGVTITPAPGEVPPPPGLAAVPPPGVPPVAPPAGDERFAPPGYVPTPAPPVSVEAGPPTQAGVAVTQHVVAGNLAVKQTADQQSQNLMAAGAPKTAQAIQQVAARSSDDASVSAAEFLEQAKAEAAEEEAAAAEKAAKAAPAAPAVPAAAAVPPVVAPPMAAPAPVAAPPMAAAPAAALAPAPAPAAPTEAVVVGGQVFTGATQADATRAAHAAVGTDAMASAQGGWVDPDTGRFVSHEIYDAHQALNTAIEQSGGNMEHPAVAEAQAQLAEATARDEELNQAIVSPAGEQVIASGVKGQEAVVSTRPSQELAVPLAGVNVTIEGVTPEGKITTAERPAAQALNDARNDRTAFTLLLDCLH